MKPNAGVKKPPGRRNASGGKRLSRKAQAALDEAREEHEAAASAIEAEHAALEKRGGALGEAEGEAASRIAAGANSSGGQMQDSRSLHQDCLVIRGTGVVCLCWSLY